MLVELFLPLYLKLISLDFFSPINAIDREYFFPRISSFNRTKGTLGNVPFVWFKIEILFSIPFLVLFNFTELS